MRQNPPLSRVSKAFRGDANRKTRFHTEAGATAPWFRWPNFGRAILSKTAAKVIGRSTMTKPWIPYAARNKIAQIMRPDWKVIEFGSGVSTLWYAARCDQLTSIEHDESWYGEVRGRLSEARTSVDYRLRALTEDLYADVSDFSDKSIDFCIVDGEFRLACIEAVYPKIKSGGYIYLDNSDVSGDPERWLANEFMLEHATWHERIVDFVPGNGTLSEGLLARF